MHDTHLVESLRIDIAFDHLPAGPRDGEEAQAWLATFMRGTALEIVDAVFDAALPMEDTWHIDRLDVDLGRIVVDATQDWRDAWARALRTRLRRLLDELRDAPIDLTADRDARHPMHRRQSQLETLLFFLQQGRMPWYGRGRRADDPRELARDVLRHRPRELAAALRHGGERPRLLRRLAAQFDDEWLGELVHALLPTEPTAVQRLLDAVRRARRPGRADDGAAITRLWEAVLDQAFSDGGPTQRPDVAVTRLQLRIALESDIGFTTPDDRLQVDAPTWQRLLADDRAWLKDTLQRLGRSPAIERRLARTLSPDLLPQLAGLWLPTAEAAAVTAWIGATAAHSQRSAPHGTDVRRDLWEATLSHFLSGGDDAAFDRRRFARKLSRRGVAPERRAAAVTPLPDPLRAGPAWWSWLHADADTLRIAVQRHVRSGPAACRQLARDWSHDMLLEAACLHAPQSRQLLAAVVCSPPLDAATLEARWARTLRFVYARDGSGPLDERAYIACLARDAARAEGRSLSQVVAGWNAAVQCADAAPAWIDRIAAARPAPVPKSPPLRPVEPSTGPSAPAPVGQSVEAAADAVVQQADANPDADAIAIDIESPIVRPEDVAPAPPPATAGARSFAGRVVAALAGLAGTLARQVARVFTPGAPEREPPSALSARVDSAAPMAIDNAGLVLIGPYLPRLFDALGLLADEKFVDDLARERAVHLLQYAVDGLREAAPESSLLLNKVLCGLDPAAGVGRRFRLSDADCALVDGLLGAVIEHWSILGSTTVAGLRETFLQRHAQLARRPDDGWDLTVEPGSFDILIDRLPWGYAMQKQPWMSEVLHVDWR